MGECFHYRQEELGISEECCVVRFHVNGGNTASSHHYSEVKQRNQIK